MTHRLQRPDTLQDLSYPPRRIAVHGASPVRCLSLAPETPPGPATSRTARAPTRLHHQRSPFCMTSRIFLPASASRRRFPLPLRLGPGTRRPAPPTPGRAFPARHS